MCGRYYTDDDTAKEIQRLVRQADEKLRGMGRGEVYPSGKAPVIIGHGEDVSAELFEWGFPDFQRKGVIFNARSETVREKKMFCDSVLKRRCVIPAKGFFEWNRAKEKFTFERADGEILYLAGIYRKFSETNHFVVLTTQANISVASVHHRMPLILEEKQLENWIFENRAVEDILQHKPVELHKKSDYEQQTLDFL